MHAGKHAARITVAVWNEQKQLFQLYCNTLEQRAGQDYVIDADSGILPTETMTAVEWAAHMVTAGPALQVSSPQPDNALR